MKINPERVKLDELQVRRPQGSGLVRHIKWERGTHSYLVILKAFNSKLIANSSGGPPQ